MVLVFKVRQLVELGKQERYLTLAILQNCPLELALELTDSPCLLHCGRVAERGAELELQRVGAQTVLPE